MKRETIVYLNLGFFDTDVTVVKELAKVYDLHLSYGRLQSLMMLTFLKNL